MVAVRIHRHAIEVIAKAPARASVSRQELELAILDEGTGGTAQVHRVGVEVLAKTPATVLLSRQELELAILDEGTGGTAQVHRVGVEVLAKTPARVSLSRQELEFAILDQGTGGEVRMHRVAVEVLGKSSIAKAVPLPYPDGIEFFLHNWVSGLTMETRYLTDVTRATLTGAEERRGLLQRPERQVQLSYLHKGKAEVDRLMWTLRRHTKRRLVVPLYQEAVTVQASSSGQPILSGTFSHRRYFDGGRVVVFPANPLGDSLMQPSDVDVYQIQSVTPTGVVMTSNLARAYAAQQWIVVPLIDVEVVLEPSLQQVTNDVTRVALTVNEVVGKSALPPSFTGDAPDGWQSAFGLPIFYIKPEWSSGIETSYRRDGQRRTEGRMPVVVPDGPRYRQVQEIPLRLERADFWKVLQFFDSRRGSLGAFWTIDEEQLWTVIDTDPGFIDVSPLGTYSDFVEDFTPHCAIVMNDGTVYIRAVNTIQNLGSWRLSLAAGNDLPSIDVTQIARFGRARVSRFDDDALPERWYTTEIMDTVVRTVELLEEKEVEL